MTKHVQFLELLVGPLANQGGGGTPATLIEKSISANGTYNAADDSADGYSKAVVNVQPDLQSKSVSITENGTTNVAPDQGKDGLSGVEVVVAVPSGMSAADKAKWEAFCANDCVDGEVPDCIEYLPWGVKYQNQNIKSVSAPQVKQIPMAAFYGDAYLQSVSFPEATMIRVYAFHTCSSLTTINAPKVAVISDADYSGVPAYGASTTFDGLTALTAINFPLLAAIRLGLNKTDALFKGVNSLASVNLSGLVSSDSSLIDGNNAAPLTGANLDLSSLEQVTGGRYVLMQCPSITSLSFPNLTEGGFYKLTGLTSLSVPKITDLNLYGCDNLTIAGITYDKTLVTKLTTMPKAVTALTDTDFPAVTELGAVCDNNTNLTNVSLSHVTTVAANAFLNCTGLLNAALSAATSLGNNVFKGCTYLATVDLSNATSLGTGVFMNCKALDKVTLPKLTQIKTQLFSGCNALTEVVIGGDVTFANITSNTNSPFVGCSAMEKLVLSGVTSVPGIATYSIYGLPAACEIYVPDDLVNSFKSATTWSSRSSYIKKLSDYVPS